MIVTFSSLLNIIFFNGIAVILLYMVTKNSTILVKIGIRIVLFLLVITMLRMLFPIELPFTHTIYVTKVWPDIYAFFRKPILSFCNINVSLHTLLSFISFMGSALLLIRLSSSYVSLKKLLKTYEPLENDMLKDIVFRINAELNHNKSFCLVASDCISTPFIFGLRKPYIVIPKLNLTEDEWYYILSHEMTHYYQKDLLIRFLLEVVQAIYWWNPLIYMLKKPLVKMQEIQTDFIVTNKLDEYKKLEYMECLLMMYHNMIEKNHAERWGLAFKGNNNITVVERISLLYRANTDYPRIKKNYAISVLLTAVFLIFSNLVVFEPYGIASEHEKGTFAIKEENTYYIENPDGTYDFFMDNCYLTTVSEIFDENIKIYKKEITYHETKNIEVSDHGFNLLVNGVLFRNDHSKCQQFTCSIFN